MKAWMMMAIGMLLTPMIATTSDADSGGSTGCTKVILAGPDSCRFSCVEGHYISWIATSSTAISGHAACGGTSTDPCTADYLQSCNQESEDPVIFDDTNGVCRGEVGSGTVTCASYPPQNG